MHVIRYVCMFKERFIYKSKLVSMVVQAQPNNKKENGLPNKTN